MKWLKYSVISNMYLIKTPTVFLLFFIKSIYKMTILENNYINNKKYKSKYQMKSN